MIPASLLCPTKSLGSCNYDKWIREALGNKEGYSSADEYYELKESVSPSVDKLRERIANYNLPYLALPSSTSEDVVLDVFVNMNTNGKPLSAV